jgi:hypothetical protein
LTADAVEQRVTGKKNDVSKVIFKERDDGKVTAVLLINENSSVCISGIVVDYLLVVIAVFLQVAVLGE